MRSLRRPGLIAQMRRADLGVCSGADLEVDWPAGPAVVIELATSALVAATARQR